MLPVIFELRKVACGCQSGMSSNWESQPPSGGELMRKKQLQENGKEWCGGLLQWQMEAMELQRIKQPIAGLSIFILKRVLGGC